MSFVSNIVKHSSQSVLSGLVSAVGSFAASVVVARLLGVEGTAAVAIALWFVFLTTTIADVGITGTLARFVAECPPDDQEAQARRLASYGLRLMLLAIIAGLLLSILVLGLYWGDIQAKYAATPREGLIFCALVLLCFVVHMAYAFAYQFLRGIRAFRRIILFSLLGSVLQIGGVIAGSLRYGANGALIGYILFSLPMIFGLRGVRLIGPVDRPVGAERMRGYAWSFYFATLFSPVLWVRADTLIVDQAIGAEAVGLFAAAGTIAALLLQVCQMISNALLPNIINASQGDRTGLDKASRIASRLALTILLPACLIAAAAAPETMDLVYGSEFQRAGSIAAILCLSATGSALTFVVASVLNATGHNGVLARNGALGAVVTVATGTALALTLGLVGAALGRLFSQGLIGLLNVRSGNQHVSGLVTGRWILRILLAGSTGALTTELLGHWLGGGLLVLFFSLAAGGTVYLLGAVLLLPLEPEERSQIESQLGALPPSLRASAGWLLSIGRQA